MIDHCISAYNISVEEKLYKVYMTDCIKELVGGDFLRYIEFVENLYNTKEETESAESVIKRLSEGLDRLGGEDNVGNERSAD